MAKPVSNPRATFAYYTVSPTSATGGWLVGDGRDATGAGAAEPSIYDDGQCDVSAEIFVSGSGDATMDPTGGSGSCSPVRTLTVNFGSAVAPNSAELSTATGSFFTNVRDVHSVSAGQTPPAERRFRLLLRGSPDCDYLRYENEAGSDGRLGTSDDVSFGEIKGKSIVVTRLADASGGKRHWEARSQPATAGGPHVAFCEKVGKRGSVYLGAYDVPFRLEITEK
jgi:hypothetical protein